MKNVFIIHGAHGTPEENWFPWLKAELEKLDYKVFVPKFPTPENQTLKDWLEVFKDYEQYFNNDTIVVGHSIGATFLLSVIEKLEKSIKAALFVSGFVDLLDNEEFDKINKTFVEHNFDWDKIKQNCSEFFIYHSDNDPYVPLDIARNLADKLDRDIVIVKNAGHFNKDAGYDKFNLLLDKIKSL